MQMIGKGYIVGMEDGTISGTDLPVYVSPNLQGGNLTHNVEVDRVPGQNGHIEGLVPTQEYIEVSFNIVPRGASRLQAKASAALPVPIKGLTLGGLPIIRMGSFPDALNGNNWVYEGGGEIAMAADGKWMMTLPLRRYPHITSVAQIAMHTPAGGT